MPSLKKSEGKKITDDFICLLFFTRLLELCGRAFVEYGTTGGRASTGGLKIRSIWGMGGCMHGTAESSVYSWTEGTLVWLRHNGGAVLLVNVFVKWFSEDSPDFALASSTTADGIPIVGLAKSLVPKDKRFNHTKVWCTFIFIDLQATAPLLEHSCTVLKSSIYL